MRACGGACCLCAKAIPPPARSSGPLAPPPCSSISSSYLPIYTLANLISVSIPARRPLQVRHLQVHHRVPHVLPIVGARRHLPHARLPPADPAATAVVARTRPALAAARLPGLVCSAAHPERCPTLLDGTARHRRPARLHSQRLR